MFPDDVRVFKVCFVFFLMTLNSSTVMGEQFYRTIYNTDSLNYKVVAKNRQKFRLDMWIFSEAISWVLSSIFSEYAFVIHRIKSSFIFQQVQFWTSELEKMQRRNDKEGQTSQHVKQGSFSSSSSNSTVSSIASKYDVNQLKKEISQARSRVCFFLYRDFYYQLDKKLFWDVRDSEMVLTQRWQTTKRSKIVNNAISRLPSFPVFAARRTAGSFPEQRLVIKLTQ